MQGYETDKWEYIPAKYQKPGNGREILWITIHCEQASMTEGRARACALYFQNPPRAGSSHVTVDDKEVIQCVYDSNIAAGAVGANTNGLHIEQSGYAEDVADFDPAHPTAEFWDSDYGKAMINNVADVAAQWCIKYDIPPVRLSDDDYYARKKGIINHQQVTRVAQAHGLPNTGHWDPGNDYPWDYFDQCLSANYNRRLSAFQESHPQGAA